MLNLKNKTGMKEVTTEGRKEGGRREESREGGVGADPENTDRGAEKL